jgi:YVTN family beta-propeller protein
MKRHTLVLTLALLGTLAVVAARELNHPTGTTGLLLVDKLGAHVRFFDPRTFTELAGIKVPANPHDFALSPDHRFAYVPIYGDGVYRRNPNPGHEVYIFDLQKRTVAGVIDISPYRAPHAIQVDRQGLLYVASDDDRKLLVIDPARRVVTAAIDTEGTGHWIAILPDGSKVYVANKDDKPFVSVIDVKARKLVARIPAPNGTQGIAASPDGRQVAAIDFKEPRMLVIDSATDTVVERITLQGTGAAAYKPYYSPDGKYLVTMNLDSQINILDAANLRGPQTVLKVGRNPMGFAFSADGATMLAANHGDGSVSVVDLRRRTVVSSFKGGTGIETLTYY